MKTNNKKGFTLIEIVVVLVIMAILAVITVPSLMAYSESGRQTNRDNIARTVYLAGQSALTERKLNGTLKQYVEFTTDPATGAETAAIIDTNVVKVPIDISTNTDPAKDDSANMEYMYYINIQNGVGDTLMTLLGDYLADKSIFADSLVLEFNAKTGVVKSVFYSENLGAEVWTYAPEVPGTGNRGNLVDRSEGALRNKKQGFYGVFTTGAVAPDAVPVSVQLKDGSINPLEGIYKNVLYAEASVPADSERMYTLSAGGASVSFTPNSTSMAGNLSAALVGSGVYKLSHTPGDPVLTVIWILDIVDGNAGSLSSYTNVVASPQTISVQLEEGGTGRAEHSAQMNSHFASEQAGTYTITDTRHLNNVRYALDKTFYQTSDIDITNYNNSPVLLAPLTNVFGMETPFSGKYYATAAGGTSYSISGLTINRTGGGNTGLFGLVQGGEIRGVSLYGAKFSADSGNLGAIVGRLNGGTVAQCNSYANVTSASGGNVGGLVGEITAGLLEQSYNGGYDNAPLDVNSGGTGSDQIGNVKAGGGNVGGLVGKSAGEIKNSYNNARVNIDSVSVDAGNLSFDPVSTTFTASNMGGIVGQNGGTVRFTYATNFVGKAVGSKSGGIVGDGTPPADSVYLGNGSGGATPVSKLMLKRMVGSAFLTGSGYLDGMPTTAANYPYPTLSSNKHIAKWEDIKDTAVVSAGLKYYELYNDSTVAYSTEGTDALAQKMAKLADGTDRLVVNDGYCLEFLYGNEYTLIINGITFTLKDTANSTTAPNWVWEGAKKFKNLPVECLVGAQTRYRVYFDNETLESCVSDPYGAGTDTAKAVNPVKIQFLYEGKRTLEGSAEADGINPATDVYFHPLYAGEIYLNQNSAAAPTVASYTVRTPRQLDNVDRAQTPPFDQEFNMDFEIYRREVNVAADGTITPKGNKLDFSAVSVVRDHSHQTYDGHGCYIRNVNAKSGLFYNNSGTIQNVVLLDSKFTAGWGVGSVGSITADNSALVQGCEISNVIVDGDNGYGGKIDTVGGVVGHNSGRIFDCYFNSTYRSAATGMYATPVINGGANSGGIVGQNVGTVERVYNTAVGPDNKPIIGGGNTATSGTVKDIYYLTYTGYNAGIPATQGVGLRPEDPKWGTMFSGNSTWNTATEATTLETITCRGLVYPFPKMSNTNHYFDWPILTTSLKYYEEYSDGTFGYYYYLEQSEVNSLKYDPKLTVVEDGYLIDIITMDKYNIRFNENSTNDLSNCAGEVVDGRRVIKLKHSDVDKLIGESNIAAKGIVPVKIRASSANAVVSGAPGFVNEIFGKSEKGFTFFDPLFAKQIFLTEKDEKPKQNAELEVRSPRQMLNINSDVDKQGFLRSANYSYIQSISLNFALNTVDNRPNYKVDGKALPAIGRNVITNFLGSYDGKCIEKGKFKDSVYRIYNLTMNVPNDGNRRNNTGAAFGDLGKMDSNNTASVKNLEFVDAQIRYVGNGMGGGIVANECYGTIDGIKVYNTRQQPLFANRNGKTDTQFCADRETLTTHLYFGKFAHSHGGVAAVVYGNNAKVVNCIVGTNSDDVRDVYDNKTQIGCFSSGTQRYDDENHKFSMLGGVVGTATGGAQIISCVNIATVEPITTKMDIRDNSSHCVGGIVGRLGNMCRDNISYGQRSTGYVIGCYNAGTIKASFGYLGGIVGRTAGIDESGRLSEVISCYNTGRINIEYMEDGVTLQQVPFKQGGSSLRIGGICGELDLTRFRNCYNIGYVSGIVPQNNISSSAGAIVGLPTYGTNIVLNCYSLSADQFRPTTIVGKLYGGGNVNWLTDSSEFAEKFGAFWEPRQALRNNMELVSSTYQTKDYPIARGHSWDFNLGDPKGYAVFTPNPNDSYYYPQLTEFFVDNVLYKNPHITQWEKIDSKYDTTLKYYEKYAGGGTEYYNLSAREAPVSSLLNDKAVIEDGYLLEIGEPGSYTVEINGTKLNAVAIGGNGRAVIEFSDAMKAKMTAGHNRIRLFTKLPTGGGNPVTNVEDNKVNRLIGTSTVDGDTQKGRDLFFDPMFPKEIKYADIKVDVKTLSPSDYKIRSPRHMDNIGKLTNIAGVNLTTGKTFTQELDMNFKSYNFAAVGTKNYANGAFTRSIVEGGFAGTYDGAGKRISGVKIVGAGANANIGLFENNVAGGTIKNLSLADIDYSGSSESLVMGAVAAINGSGSIQRVAVINPKLNALAVTGGSSIGGIVGNNSGSVSDVYLVAKDNASPPPITAANAAAKVGGIVGANVVGGGGTVTRALYLAPVPEQGKNPISGGNMNTANNVKASFFLAGNGYNEQADATNGGESRSTAELTELRDGLAQNASWRVHWGKIDAYPYPSLISIAPPISYPTVTQTAFLLAYYERYDGGGYGWFINGTAEGLNNSKRISESGYAVIVPEHVTYSVSVDGVEMGSSTVESIDGKSIIKLPNTAAGIVKVAVKQGAVGLYGAYSYYNPLSAKAVFNTATPSGGYTVRTAGQFLNISKRADTTGFTFEQECDLDFAGISLTASAITGEFKGTYNAGGKTIKNLTINASGTDDVGLFSVNSGTITGVTLIDSNIKGKANVGGIAGRNSAVGRVSGVEVKNTAITGDSGSTGALCGKNENAGYRPKGKWTDVTINGRKDSGEVTW